MKEAMKMNEGAVWRQVDQGDASVSRIVAGQGFASAFWMTYPDHLAAFDRWRWESRRQDDPLGKCVDLYCAGLPGGFAIDLVRNYLIDMVRW